MIKLCDLDIGLYQCACPSIRASEVILTEERIRHIQSHHPNDYERYHSYMTEIILRPDYIIEDIRPNTAMILKKILSEGEHFRLVLRLAASTDNPNYKNSVITFMKIREKEWNRLLRNKKILYKFE